MSNQIDIAFVQQYAATVMHLAQQMGSKLRPYVRVKDVVGKSAFFERIGATASQKKTSRNADTPLVNTPHSRRRVSMDDWEWADLVDKQDEIRLLIDPASEYVINAAKAFNRTIDDTIIAAFNGNAFSIDAADAASTVALPAGQQIANGGTNLTLAKVKDAKLKLDNADVEEDERVLVVSPAGLRKLLDDTQATSSDFNSVKALVQGDIDTYLGFKWLKSTRLPKVANIRSCFAWHKAGIGIALGKDVLHRVDERPDKSYATQVYFCMTLGATRVEEERVVQIDIDESV